MKKFLAAFLTAGSLLFASPVNAEIQIYEGTDEYIMSEFETPDVAKQRAKQKAERMAIEKAGVFVESTTEVSNMMVTKDEIITMTGGILKLVENPKYEMIPLENGETFIVRATVKAQIDTDDIAKWLNRNAGERSELVDQNRELQRAIEEQDRQIAELKAKIANAGTAQDKEKISEQFAAEDKNFMANQKLQEALKFYYAGNLNGAINSCTDALSFNPNAGLAYSLRGTIYYQLGQYPAAVADLSRAGNLNPTDEKIFYNRALANIKLQNYRAAADDFTIAIQLNPNDADAYYNRALCYQRLRDNQRYQADMAKARSLGYSS